MTQDLIDNIVLTQLAFREGAGPGALLKLDLNFNFKTEVAICIENDKFLNENDGFCIRIDEFK